jgi:hypothetical protein
MSNTTTELGFDVTKLSALELEDLLATIERIREDALMLTTEHAPKAVHFIQVELAKLWIQHYM